MIKLQKKRAWQSAGEKNLKFLSQYFSLIKYCSCDYGKSFTTVLTSISYKSCCCFTISYYIVAVAQSTCTRDKWIKKTYFPIFVCFLSAPINEFFHWRCIRIILPMSCSPGFASIFINMNIYLINYAYSFVLFLFCNFL